MSGLKVGCMSVSRSTGTRCVALCSCSRFVGLPKSGASSRLYSSHTWAVCSAVVCLHHTDVGPLPALLSTPELVKPL
jgi:hypothetical protein